jgi:S-adenosylmethionine uptake transporter
MSVMQPLLNEPGRDEGAQRRLIAIAVCLLGVAMFSIMDVMMKQASIAIGAYSALIFRGIFASLFSGGLMLFGQSRWPPFPVLRLHIWRGVLIAAMAWLFFWALVHLPVAEAIALSFIAPIIALYLAALLLGEKIRRSAIIAALMGLAGVVVILSGRLTGHYDRQAILGISAVLISAVLFAYNLVLQRQQALLAGPAEISFFLNVTVILTLLPLAPFLLQMPQLALAPIMVGAGILAALSQFCLSWAYARAEAQQLIPMEYSAFLWAGLFGWLVFDEPLQVSTLMGTVMIVAGCLIVAREKPDVARIEAEIA